MAKKTDAPPEAPADGELGTLKWFDTLKQAEMVAHLVGLRKANKYTIKSVSGSKKTLRAVYVNLLAAERDDDDEEDNGAEDGDPDAEAEAGVDAPALAAARTDLAQQLFPDDSAISKSTKELLKKLRYANNFPLKDVSADKSQELKQVAEVVEHLVVVLDNVSLTPHHPRNFASMQEALREKFGRFTATDSLFVEFFQLLGLDVDAPGEDERQTAMAVQASTSNDDDTTDRTELETELKILRASLQIIFLRWADTFPAPEPEDAVFPEDFDSATDRKKFREWMKNALDDYENEHGAGTATDQNMSVEDTNTLVCELLKVQKDYPFEDNKGRTRAAMLACLKDVRGQRAASEARARSKSATPGPKKGKEKVVADVDGDSELGDTGKKASKTAPGRKGTKRGRESEDDDTSDKGRKRRAGASKSSALFVSENSDDEDSA